MKMGVLLHMGLKQLLWKEKKKTLKVHVQTKEYGLSFLSVLRWEQQAPFPLCEPESNPELNNYNIAEPSGGEKNQ